MESPLEIEKLFQYWKLLELQVKIDRKLFQENWRINAVSQRRRLVIFQFKLRATLADLTLNLKIETSSKLAEHGFYLH